MMTKRLVSLCIGLICALATGCGLDYGHTSAYTHAPTKSITAPAQQILKQRILLLGDAGYATLTPYEASLALAAARAGIAPSQTLVLMLGDNVYEDGFPRKASGAAEFSAKQLALIDRLVAQLELARRSKAALVFVPGNHDWEAGRIDDEADFVDDYASKYDVDTSVEPFESGAPPWPEVRHRPGVSVVFIDSTWLLRTDQRMFERAIARLDVLLNETRTRYPEDLILVAAHHPLHSGGIHGGHYTDVRIKYFKKLREAILGVDIEDVDHPQYRRYIDGVEKVLRNYHRVIIAAGHDHNLQIAESRDGLAPEYRIISGAASDVAPVWHEEDTLFSLADEGFVELEVSADSVFVAVYTVGQNAPVYRRALE